MNMLPSMLIAATLIGSSQTPQANCNVDLSALQSQLKDNCIESQVIIGNASDAEALLGELGINIDALGNCFIPSVPETEAPEAAPDTTPEQEVIPPTDTTPETDDTTQPDTDIILPEINTPETNTPENDEIVDTQPEVSNKSYVEQVVDLVNAERAKVNLPALTMSEELNQAAQIRAVETVQSFSHTRPNGSSFSSVLTENGISYRGAGENIAWGQKTPEAVVNAWMNSEGHRANILNKNFTTIGIGYHLNGSTPYWAQLFTY